MTEKTLSNYFTDAVLMALTETFEDVQGLYLDKGTSLFETLATISAEDASRPVSATCASIAAQVEHVNYYLEVLLKVIQGEQPQVDWNDIWQRVEAVTPAEWEDSQARLRSTYADIRTLASDYSWQNDRDMGGAMGMLLHTAYHLGEIRQALCTIQTTND